MRAYFEQFGTLNEFSFRKTFAFVSFDQSEACNKCVAVETHTLNDKRFHVRVSDTKKARRRDDPDRQSTNQVYVANVPRETNHMNLRQRFEELGELSDVRVVYDSVSAEPKYAKVTFSKEEDFNAVLQREHVAFLGRVLRVARARR